MIVLNSRDVPAAERFDWWHDLTARELIPTRISSDHAADFRACAAALELGQVQVSMLEFSELRSTRTRRLIQSSDPELWELTLVTGGAFWLQQDRSETYLRAGDLVLYNTSRPFDSNVLAGRAQLVMVHLPHRATVVSEHALGSLVARRLPSEYGTGAILRTFLHGLAEQATTLATTQLSQLGAATVELASAFLAGVADVRPPGSTRNRTAALTYQIKAFVLDHLHDPELSPATVAAAHHISVRYLHQLFEQDGETVGAFIRRRRLQRCRTELADRTLADRSVAAIGARWGFPDPATFSRVFKRAYELAPGEYRRSMLPPAGPVS